MSTKELWLGYRGAVRALAAHDGKLLLVTEHPEGQPTALVRIDPLSGKLDEQALPGGVDLAGAGGRWLVAGTDGHVWAGAFGSLAPLGAILDPAPTAVAPLADGAVAALSGASLVVLDGAGAEVARLALPAAGTALAADPSGHFAAVGCADGTVAVATDEEGSWALTASEKLHDGAVTALRFEDDELRFRSAGSDRKLLATHARGALEPLDRAGRHGHESAVRGIAAHGDAVWTTGEDKQLKTWRRGSKRQPSTLREGVGRAVALAVVVLDKVRHLAVAASDDSIRLFPVDDDSGKAAARTRRVHGAMARARHELGLSDAGRRKAALDALAGYADADAIALLASRASDEERPDLRVHAVKRLGSVDHPRVVRPLEELLEAAGAPERAAALDALRKRLGSAALRPLALALECGHADLGVAAVRALAELDDSVARARIVGALDHDDKAVREAALEALEGLHPDVPEASLLGLRSGHADLRWLALLRLHQRKLLSAADRALRAATEDDDGDVRALAYRLRLLAHPAVAAHLRGLDGDLHRNLHSIETHGSKKKAKPPRAKKQKGAPDTVGPLLQACGSRMRDTCLRGASHLALLGDGRALGVLLTLSREGEAPVRVRTCRALQALGDPRALGRLQAMLRDDERQVRDAAFTAVERMLSKEPLRAAEVGLAATHADVRERGLRVLSKLLKSKPPKKTDTPACALLRQALDDAEAKLRSAAFKAVLRLQIGGSEATALAFALQGLHADVRREAVTELMAEVRQAWAWALLLERLDDPDAKLRREILAFCRKKGRGRKPDAVVAALGSRFADLRLEAVRVLAAKVDARAQALLVEALDDDDPAVRTEAFAAVQRAGGVEAIAAAAGSRHADVRIAAASGLAEAGRAEALEPLLAQVRTERPEVGDLAKLWHGHTSEALRGLAWLGDEAATEPVAAWLADDDATLRAEAARTLAHVAPAAALLAHLQHSDPKVRTALALGLAWRGDPTGAPLLRDAPPQDRLSAALGLADDGALLALLDERRDAVRAEALRVVLLLDWAGTDAPERLLAALTSSDPRTRLAVASVLEAWGTDGLDEAVAAQVLARDRQPVWPVPVPQLRAIALALRSGTWRHRLAALEANAQLGATARTTADAAEAASHLEHRWALADARSGGTLSALPDPGAPGDAALTELVFGTYVGLASQVAGRKGMAVRAAALRRIGRMEGVGAEAAIDALLPSLSDRYGPVRSAAWAGLEAAGMDPRTLAEEGLASGHLDLGQAGLELLAEGNTDVLWEVVERRSDRLAGVALDLLRARLGDVPACTRALGAAWRHARSRAVGVLEDAEGEAAAEALRGALESPHADVRSAVALALGTRKDAAAFDALVLLLRDEDTDADEVVEALCELGDPRGATALLDRLEDDPGGTADADVLLEAVGELRAPDVAERLVAHLERHPDRADEVLDALTTISGYDQWLRFDAEAPDADTSWLADQHPRHDAVFATVLQLRADRKAGRALRRLWKGAMWAKGSEVDAPLARMLVHADTSIRQSATSALGWRVRFRGADREALQAALGHRDATTAFLAAEGLARAGDDTGISVLLASIDTLDDLAMRRRAVLALGPLRDERALDKLLDIASDAEHALIEAAAEALGHLAGTERGADITDRLLQLSRLDGNVGQRALVGLRWVGTPTAWDRIREASADPAWRPRVTAAELLCHDDGPGTQASQAALERLVLEDDTWRVNQAAGVSLRRLAGPESLEPDYVFLRGQFGSPEEDTIARLRADGASDRLLDVLADPRCDDDAIEPLLLALAARDPLPIDAAVHALGDARARGAAMGARLLGRAEKLPKAASAAVATAASDALDAWEARRTRGEVDEDDLERVRWALWAAARHGSGDAVIRALDAPDPGGAPVRAAAAQALVLLPDAEHLGQIARTADASVRALAAGALAAADADGASILAGALLDDRAAAEPLLQAGASPPELAEAAGRVHVQGIALPHLVARGNTAALRSALDSPVEGARLGAVEALGAVAAAESEDALRAFATDEARDEEERKAAWRALRRSRRTRAAREAS